MQILQQLPESAVLVPPFYPLVGKNLPVLGQTVRKAELNLLLLLPNRNRCYVTVYWTDAYRSRLRFPVLDLQ